MQYLIAYTANRNGLVDGEWITNGAGLSVSHKFGFGAIDAEAIVSRGRHWVTIPAQLSQVVSAPLTSERTLSNGTSLTETFTVESDIVSLEHVVLVFTMSFPGITEDDYNSYRDEYYDNFEAFFNDSRSIFWPERGTVQINLTSPSGTTSRLLPRRTGDIFPGSYDDWPFMSVHFWGEDPTGTWTIDISFDTVGAIQVEVPEVTFYGTSQVPEAVSGIPAQCSAECDPTRGCAASGAEFCDACAELRVASTLACTSSCPEGLTQRNGYCYDATQPESACEAEKPDSAVNMRACTIFLLLAVAIAFFLLVL